MARHIRQLFDLQGKTALITGGSRGLGLQMAEALGEMGARLAITAPPPNTLASSRLRRAPSFSRWLIRTSMAYVP